MSERIVAGTTRLGLAALAAALAFAAMSRPSAAQGGATPAPAAGESQIDTGKAVFANSGCGGCHALADAGATGRVGPSFDGNPDLTEDFVVTRVTNGQGAMPAFGGQLSKEQIAAVAAYVAQAAVK